MKLDLTPWATRDLDPVVKEILSGMEPRAATVHIGKARTDWRAVVTYQGHVVVDVRGDGPTEVAEAAIVSMARVIGSSGETAKEWLAHLDWHGHDIEVDVT